MLFSFHYTYEDTENRRVSVNQATQSHAFGKCTVKTQAHVSFLFFFLKLGS